jgi:type IV fimbrial biogenesis protein FimT
MRGVTLPELLVVLALVALLAILGSPALAALRANLATALAAQHLASLFGLARASATARGMDAVLCPLVRSGPRAACGASFSQGWLLFLDRNGDGSYRVGDDEMLRVHLEPAGLRAVDREGEPFAGTFVYRPDGFVRQPATINLCHRSGGRVRGFVVSMSGRVRKTRGNGPCAA